MSQKKAASRGFQPPVGGGSLWREQQTTMMLHAATSAKKSNTHNERQKWQKIFGSSAMFYGCVTVYRRPTRS
jgi:hypothetical protein